MRTLPVVLSMALVIGAVFSSCNTNKDDDGPFTLPDLVFSYAVTGHINQSDNWESPENSNTLGGHGNGVISNHSTTVNGISISGVGTNYTFAVSATTANVEPGTYTVTSASFTDGTNGFVEFVSGTLRIDAATINFTANGVTYYTIDGNFSVQLNDGFTPPNSINFSADFTGLNVQSI